MAQTPLQQQQSRRQLAVARVRAAEAEVAAALAERRVDRIANAYDALEPGADRKRRTAKVQRGTESDVLTQHKQLKGIGLSRDLLRNFTASIAMDWQMRVNVVGPGPVIKLHTGEKAADKAGQAYFKRWAKDCDSRDDMPFNEVLQCVMSAVGSDGGAIVAVDTFDRDDGKLLFWGVDQMATIKQAEWKRLAPPEYREEIPGKKGKHPMAQERGYVRDRRGRVMAHVVTAKPGLMTVKFSEATILRRGLARFVKRPKKLNQLVAVPEYLPMATDMEDSYELRVTELLAAKRAAKTFAWVKSMSSEEDALLQSGRPAEAEITEQNEDGEAQTVKKKLYEALDELTGGYLEYMDPDDDVTIHAPTRPNPEITPFFDHCRFGAGASVGLAKAYTALQADRSYTAFLGELVMTWRTFDVNQKMLERRLCDWVAVEVLTWGMANNGLQELPAGWEDKIAWGWPQKPVIDALKEARGLQQLLKIPATDWSEILGPDWEERINTYGEQLQVLRDNKIPASVFETVAGAPLEGAADGSDNQTDEE